MGKLTAGGQPAEGEVARAERAKLARQAIQVQAHADEAGIGRASDPARKLRLPRGGKAPYTSRNRLRRSCRLTSAPALMAQSRFQCAHNHPSLVTPIDFILGSALESPGTRGWYNFRETAGTHRGHVNMFPAVLRTPSSASVFLSFPAIPVRPRTFTAVTRVQIPPGTPKPFNGLRSICGSTLGTFWGHRPRIGSSPTEEWQQPFLELCVSPVSRLEHRHPW